MRIRQRVFDFLWKSPDPKGFANDRAATYEILGPRSHCRSVINCRHFLTSSQVSIPVESELNNDSDAMRITEFWRLEKRQFLELYAAWSDGTEEPGTFICPG